LSKPYITNVVSVYVFMRPLFAVLAPIKCKKWTANIKEYLVMYKYLYA